MEKYKYKPNQVLLHNHENDSLYDLIQIIERLRNSNQYKVRVLKGSDKDFVNCEIYLGKRFVEEQFVLLKNYIPGQPLPQRVLCPNPILEKLTKLCRDIPVLPEFKVGDVIYSRTYKTMAKVVFIDVDSTRNSFIYTFKNKDDVFTDKEKNIQTGQLLTQAEVDALLAAVNTFTGRK